MQTAHLPTSSGPFVLETKSDACIDFDHSYGKSFHTSLCKHLPIDGFSISLDFVQRFPSFRLNS